MILVIQIALGIVLAVVILVYWRELLALSGVLVVIAAIAIGLWIAAKPVLNNITEENFGVWATMVGLVALAGLLWWGVEREQKKHKSSLDSPRKDVSTDTLPPEA